MLANASVEALLQAGVIQKMHACDIKAKTRSAGEVEAVLLGCVWPDSTLTCIFLTAPSAISCYSSSSV